MMDSLDLQGKTVVVTGASGYIGCELVDALVKHDCTIIRVSRVDLTPLPGVKTIKADICNADFWHDIVALADIIYHLAGNTSVYEAAKDPVLSLNSTLLPINYLIQAAQDQKRKPRVIFASTATVYGLTSILPVSETVKPKPITVYDLHKFFAEQQLALASQLGILAATSLRLANVYGPSNSMSSAADRGILSRVAAIALQGKTLKVYGDGSYLRDYIYITDVVNALLISAISPKVSGESFNIASGVGTTVKQAFTLIARESEMVAGSPVKVEMMEWPEGVASIEFRNFTANIEKYKTATGWSPQINLNDGISKLIASSLKSN